MIFGLCSLVLSFGAVHEWEYPGASIPWEKQGEGLKHHGRDSGPEEPVNLLEDDFGPGAWRGKCMAVSGCYGSIFEVLLHWATEYKCSVAFSSWLTAFLCHKLYSTDCHQYPPCSGRTWSCHVLSNFRVKKIPDTRCCGIEYHFNYVKLCYTRLCCICSIA